MAAGVDELKRLSSLLDSALDLEPGAREAWLVDLARRDPPSAQRLRDMLASADAPATHDPLARGPAFDVTDASAPAPGEAVGPYRLLRELGAGGMSTVWLAERADGQLQRKVALKLPHIGWAPSLAERFAREREILSSLEHPHVARLYDAGVDERGRPFMAIEYVEGQPIDAYCRERALDVAGILTLLLQVAEAVAFAHSRLVLHRDLKPGNILVTPQGQVRLLDFGIAKLMQGDSTQETALTQASGRAMTLDYASPEQIRGEPVGTASDVYSLGVVAFELLTGVRPYRLKRGTAAELEEAITGQDLPSASTAATQPKVRARLRGDLDAILRKALQKDAAGRYATVAALAQDWREHLAGRRVMARPDSIALRVARLARRQRMPLAAAGVATTALVLALGFGATALVVTALLAGIAAALWQARRAREQARAAQRAARTAEAVQDFLEGIFKANAGDQDDAVAARQRTAIQLLDAGAARIDKALDDAPEAKLRVLRTLASIYEDLGDIERMAEVLGQRLAVVERTQPGASAERVRGLADLAGALAVIGQDAEALRRLTQAQAMLKDVPDADDDTHVAVDLALADYFGQRADVSGLEPARDAVERLGKRPPSVLLMGALMLQGKFERLAARHADAVRTLRTSVGLAARLPGGGESGLGVALLELSLAEAAAGEPRAAEASMRKAIAVVTANAGESSPMAIVLLGRLGQLLAEQGRPGEALLPLAEARRRIDLQPALPQRQDLLVPVLVFDGRALRRLGRLDEALARFDEAAATAAGADGDPNGALFAALGRVQVLTLQGRFDAALEELATAKAVRDRHGLRPYMHTLAIAQAQIALAGALGDPALAALEWRRFIEDPVTAIHRTEGGVLALEAEVALAGAAAVEAAAVARAALATLAARTPEPDGAFDRLRIQQVLAEALGHLGQHDEVRLLLADMLDANARCSDAAHSPERIRILRALARTHAALGDAASADAADFEARAIAARHSRLGPQFERVQGAFRPQPAPSGPLTAPTPAASPSRIDPSGRS